MSNVTVTRVMFGNVGRCDYCGEQRRRESSITSAEYEGTALACVNCTFDFFPDRKDLERIPLPVVLWGRELKLEEIEWWDAPLLRPVPGEDAFLVGTTKLVLLNESGTGRCCYAGVFAAPLGRHIVYWYQQPSKSPINFQKE